MSAPDTNVDKQARRHRGPIFGISLAVGFATVLFLGLLAWTAEQGGTPGEDDAAAIASDS